MLEVALKALQALGPVVAAIPAVQALFAQVKAALSEDDQAVLQDAYADLMADNDEGHARLQAKLAAAANRPADPG